MQNIFFKKLMALTLAACLALSGFQSAAFSDETEELPIEAPATESTAEPTAEATAEPTAEPTVEATAEPTAEPTIEPTVEPTVAPTAEPTETPALSEAVQAVQEQINALPAVDALNEENMAAAYEQVEAAYIAYLALSADEQAQITGAEAFAALFAALNAQAETLDEEGTYSITTTSSTTGGTVQVMDLYSIPKTTASFGESLKIIMTPNEGYTLLLFTVNDTTISGSTLNDYSVGDYWLYPCKMTNSELTIDSEFVRTYAITITTTENGEANVVNIYNETYEIYNPATAAANATIQVNASGDDGYALDILTVTDANGTAVPTTQASDEKKQIHLYHACQCRNHYSHVQTGRGLSYHHRCEH